MTNYNIKQSKPQILIYFYQIIYFLIIEMKQKYLKVI